MFGVLTFQLSCLLHILYLPTLRTDKIVLPQNTFCLFATGDLIFEERVKVIAPSAEFQGAGSITATAAQMPNSSGDGTIDLQPLYGAIYFIKDADKVKVVELAYERMILADLEVYPEYGPETNDSMDCLSLDEGLSPRAFPLPIYSEFPRQLSAQDYVRKLKRMRGVSFTYFSWLEKRLAGKADDGSAPPPAYIRPSSFVPPPVESTSATIGDGRESPLPQYDVPKGQTCAFVVDELVFEEAMKSVAPAATSIGAGMLLDRYIALGGGTVPGEYQPYGNRGFDRVWGVAYLLGREDVDEFLRFSVARSFFITNVRVKVKEHYQAECTTVDIGLLPSGFPYRVFQPSELNLGGYLKRLSDVGVPRPYTEAIERLAEVLKKSEPKKVQSAAGPSSSPENLESVVDLTYFPS